LIDPQIKKLCFLALCSIDLNTTQRCAACVADRTANAIEYRGREYSEHLNKDNQWYHSEVSINDQLFEVNNQKMSILDRRPESDIHQVAGSVRARRQSQLESTAEQHVTGDERPCSEASFLSIILI
jgi:hypothetical protein